MLWTHDCFVRTTCLLLVLHSTLANTFYADNELEQTVIYRSLPKKEKIEMQQEILSLLGLHHRPKPSTHGTDNSAPQFMIDLYKSFVVVDSNSNYSFFDSQQIKYEKRLFNLTDNSLHTIKDADIIMSFVNHAHHNHLRVRHDRDRRFWFDVSDVSPGEDLMDAELRLYRQPENDVIKADGNYTLVVYEMIQGFDPEDKELKQLDTISVPPDKQGWLTMNVSSAVSNWVAFPHQNLGLFLTVESKGREISPMKIGLVGHKGAQDRQPFMTAFFKTPTSLHIRKTRAARRRRQKKQSNTYADDATWNPYTSAYRDRHSKRSCQKRTLYVSFRDLGWQDWIIAPDGYAAFYCHGECSFPLNAHMNATNHAIVQTLVHLMNPYKVPKPCCAPTKLSAISVLYFDDNSNVILKKYKNMVVKSCGCH